MYAKQPNRGSNRESHSPLSQEHYSSDLNTIFTVNVDRICRLYWKSYFQDNKMTYQKMFFLARIRQVSIVFNFTSPHSCNYVGSFTLWKYIYKSAKHECKLIHMHKHTKTCTFVRSLFLQKVNNSSNSTWNTSALHFFQPSPVSPPLPWLFYLPSLYLSISPHSASHSLFSCILYLRSSRFPYLWIKYHAMKRSFLSPKSQGKWKKKALFTGLLPLIALMQCLKLSIVLKLLLHTVGATAGKIKHYKSLTEAT